MLLRVLKLVCVLALSLTTAALVFGRSIHSTSIAHNILRRQGNETNATKWIIFSILGPIIVILVICIWCFRRYRRRKAAALETQQTLNGDIPPNRSNFENYPIKTPAAVYSTN
jgi:heme/copper-type cytochrome/quinol oxidase subunit 2